MSKKRIIKERRAQRIQENRETKEDLKKIKAFEKEHSWNSSLGKWQKKRAMNVQKNRVKKATRKVVKKSKGYA